MNQTETLNISQPVVSICCSRLDKRNILCIGTINTLQCYDVLDNSDIFFKEINDGINDLVVLNETVIVGGNCSIQGFDKFGNDVFWTVVGGNVSSMISIKDKKGTEFLLVGADDGSITKFLNDDILLEIQESDGISHLVALGPNIFGFALTNGSIGVYEGKKRLWKLKLNSAITSLACFDIDGDSSVEMMVGCANGVYQGRNIITGKSCFESGFPATLYAPAPSIISLLVCDYNDDGTLILLAVASNGEVRGIQTAEKEKPPATVLTSPPTSSPIILSPASPMVPASALAPQPKSFTSSISAALSSKTSAKNIPEVRPPTPPNVLANVAVSPSPTATNAEIEELQETLVAVNQKKQEMTLIVNSLKESIASKNEIAAETGLGVVIPQTTDVKYLLSIVNDSFNLNVSTNNDTIIKAVIVNVQFLSAGEASIDGDIYLSSNNEISGKMNVPIKYEKDLPVELKIKVIVGARASKNYHVFETVKNVPKFVHFKVVRTCVEPSSFVRFTVKESLSKIEKWVENSFLIDNSMKDLWSTKQSINLKLISLRDHNPVCVSVEPQAAMLSIIIKASSIDLVSDLVQDLFSKHLGITVLTPDECLFGEEMQNLKTITNHIQSLNEVRMKMTTDAADLSSGIKMWVLKCEDTRTLGQMVAMKNAYKTTFDMNREAISEHMKRYNQHQQLIEYLKTLNGIIQKSANLRIGSAKTSLVSMCRDAVKSQNMPLLIQNIGLNGNT